MEFQLGTVVELGKPGNVQEIGDRMEVDDQWEIPSAVWISVFEHLNFITWRVTTTGGIGCLP